MSDGGMRHELFAERLATVEVSNEFQKSTLKEISQTLKGVVETQAKLANQKEEISSMNNDIRVLRSQAAKQETDIRLLEMTLNKTVKSVEDCADEIDKLKVRVGKNETFTRQATYVITAIGIPFVIWLAQHFGPSILPLLQ